MRRLFYTSPVSASNLDEWGALSAAVRRAVELSCGSGVAIEVGDQPVFGAGSAADVEETFAGLEELRLGRAVRVDLWCSTEHYATVALTLGGEIKRPERRALEKKLRKVLRGEALLRTTEGPFSEDFALVFGYAMSAAEDAAARADIEHLLFPFEGPLYLGETWLLQDDQERIDEASYRHIREVGPGLATFLASGGDAEERLWQRCAAGGGVLALYPDDPALPELIRRFQDVADLRILVAEKPDSGLRVAIDRRGQSGDSLVVAYAPAGPPEIEQLPLFVI